MPKEYQQITREDRDRIATLRAMGRSFRAIGLLVGRHHMTVSRELKRNATLRSAGTEYLPNAAQKHADARKAKAHKRGRLRSPGLKDFVVARLSEGWSPERIAGRWTRIEKRPISHEAIYKWIYDERRDLIQHLVRAHIRRRRFKKRGGKRTLIPSRIPISQRPQHIQLRKEAGHWEGDLIVSSKSSPVIQVLVERRTRLAKLRLMPIRAGASVVAAVCGALEHYPARLRRSITWDNGTENAKHLDINRRLGTASYFCDPMQSWQKGSVENIAGLVRRRLPKKTDFATVPTSEVEQTEQWLNNLPRKCLGFATPAEAFADEWCT